MGRENGERGDEENATNAHLTGGAFPEGDWLGLDPSWIYGTKLLLRFDTGDRTDIDQAHASPICYPTPLGTGFRPGVQ